DCPCSGRTTSWPVWTSVMMFAVLMLHSPRARVAKRARLRADRVFCDPQAYAAAPCQAHPNDPACAGCAPNGRRVLLVSEILRGSVQRWTCHLLHPSDCRSE